MNEPKQLSSGMKQALDLGPSLIFFGLFVLLRDQSLSLGGETYSGLILAAAAFLPVLGVATFLSWRLTGHVTPMQIFTGVAVVFFTALTVVFNDERFFKMKTTLAYGSFATLILLGLGLRKLWLKSLLGEMMPMEDAGWWRLSVGAVIGFVLLAIGNEVIWRTQTTERWVFVETFVFPILLAVYLTGLIMSLSKYHIDEDQE